MVILITGASGGIGQELTRKFATNYSVIAVARNLERLKKLKNSIKQDIEIKKIDISKQKQVKTLFTSIPKLDVIINTAAILKPVGKFTENDLTEWKKNIEVTLLGTVNVCYYALPLLLKSKRGKIINFAGGGSAYPRPYHTAYATSKAAVVRFTETLAQEFPKLDINVISPGAYETKMWEDETFDQKPKSWGDINHLLLFIEFLLSKKSDEITGKFIHYKDSWKDFNKKISKENLYTLRRVEK